MTYREFFQEQVLRAKTLNKEESAVKILITEISGMNINSLYLHFEDKIDTDIKNKILDAINIYFYENKPIQYILGYTYFYGLKLMVNENVLIPRPETELLVEKIIENLKEYENPKILDIGCGSGAIALALKNQIKNSYVTAIDISQSAIDVAKRNAILNNLDVKFIQSDLYENVNEKYDIIVSNPPYIAYNEEVDSIVLENEPHSALFATNNGLYFYEQILKSAYLYLNFPSVIGFEIPYNKNDELIYLCNQYFPKQKYEIIKDLNKKSRILIIKNYWR